MYNGEGIKIWFFLVLAGFLTACGNSPKKDVAPPGLLESRRTDHIRKVPGEDEQVSEEILRKGEVLIAYSDCSVCHREDEKDRGPAFRDIAARYPLNETYIKMLASRVISGGSGAWGYAVMTPHPDLSNEDAETMVTYILSLDK